MTENLMPIILKAIKDGLIYSWDIFWSVVVEWWELWVPVALLSITAIFIERFRK